MVTIKLNIAPVVKLISKKIDRLKDKEYLLRPIAFDVIVLMRKRIQIDGIASDGSPIGTYSKGYMRRRKKFNRGDGKKVIVSLTRQLENDYSVIATDRGYAIGFKNPFNLKKARYVEEIKKRKIFNLTSSEQQYVTVKLNKLIDEA